MTNTVAVITDSVACLTPDQVSRYGIGIVPLNFYASGKLYRDAIDITPSQAYELFLQDPDSFKTSAASPDDFLQAFRRAAATGRDILCITLSSHLSATYDIGRAMSKLIKQEFDNLNIRVIDSGTATTAEGMIVLAAARAAADGQDLETVLETAEGIREKVRSAILVNSVKYVYRSGRVPKIAARLGSALNIKPLFTIKNTIRFLGVVRSTDQGIDRILGIMHGDIGDRPVNVAVMHVYAPEDAAALRERIQAEFNCADIWQTEFSPIIGYTCGTGALGISFYPEV